MAKSSKGRKEDREVAARRDAILKRMLETPPQPRKSKPQARRKAARRHKT